MKQRSFKEAAGNASEAAFDTVQHGLQLLWRKDMMDKVKEVEKDQRSMKRTVNRMYEAVEEAMGMPEKEKKRAKEKEEENEEKVWK